MNNMKKIFLSSVFFLFLFDLFAQSVEQKMDALVAAYTEDNKFNGVALVAHKGKVVFAKAYGYRDAEAKAKHAVNDIFQIGSITKQITAAVIMQLHEEGKLSLQDKLSKYFTGFKHGDEITIEQLLTHTSGIYNYTNDKKLLESDVTKHRSRDEMIKIFKNYPSDFLSSSSTCALTFTLPPLLPSL